MRERERGQKKSENIGIMYHSLDSIQSAPPYTTDHANYSQP